MDNQLLMTDNLIKAVIENNVEHVNEFLNQGIDPNNTLDAAHVTPLHFAAQNNSLEIIPLLIEAGADLHAQTEPDGQTPLDIALLHQHEKVVQILIAYSNNTDASEN